MRTNIERMSLRDLVILEAKVIAAKNKKRSEARKAARNKVIAMLKGTGLSPSDLLNGRAKAKGKRK